MRIAITADLHLTTRKKHPERFEALEYVLRRCGELKLDRLIIAGDLFDKSRPSFAEFEKTFRKTRPEELAVTIIPGNHDPDLTAKSLAVEGVEAVSEPALQPAGELALMLVPYKAGTTMAEHLPPFADQLTPRQWVLISHGDWLAGQRTADPNEPGIYMPLMRSDLNRFQPAAALLGHIHAPYDRAPVHYAGSPCPLDVTETGVRRFLVFDTANRTVIAQIVEGPRLYFDETVVMLPVEDEQAFLKAELARRVQSWDLPQGWENRVQVRLRIAGYAADRAGVESAAREALADFTFYDEGPDLSSLEQVVDADRIHIARQVQEEIDALEWPAEPPEPAPEDIALEALRVIWGD